MQALLILAALAMDPPLPQCYTLDVNLAPGIREKLAGTQVTVRVKIDGAPFVPGMHPLKPGDEKVTIKGFCGEAKDTAKVSLGVSIEVLTPKDGKPTTGPLLGVSCTDVPATTVAELRKKAVTSECK